jgi:hypothetical protein
LPKNAEYPLRSICLPAAIRRSKNEGISARGPRETRAACEPTVPPAAAARALFDVVSIGICFAGGTHRYARLTCRVALESCVALGGDLLRDKRSVAVAGGRERRRPPGLIVAAKAVRVHGV